MSLSLVSVLQGLTSILEPPSVTELLGFTASFTSFNVSFIRRLFNGWAVANESATNTTNTINATNVTTIMNTTRFLTEDLMFPDGFTMLAPVNSAFELVSFDGVDVDRFLKPDWGRHLAEMVTHFIASGIYSVDDLAELGAVVMLNGANSSVVTSGSNITIGGGVVSDAVLRAIDGYVRGLRDISS